MGEITIHALPGILRDIAEITGDVEAALTVARRFGGRRLSIPKEITRNHPLTKAIGLDFASLVAWRLGGDRHIVPSAIRLIRWAEARRLKALGFTNGEIGLRLGLTSGHVGRLVAGVEPIDRLDTLDHIETGTCAMCGRGLTPDKPGGRLAT